jgi:hypothetical protein
MRLAKLFAVAATTALVLVSGASALSVDTTPPPDGVVGTPYTWVFKPVNGAPPFSFSLAGGDLPPGLKIESDGTFHGTPTTPGTFNFDVNVTQDWCGCGDSQRSFTVKIRDRLTITTNALQSAVVGSPYTATLGLSGTGGLGMWWSIASGALPPGLTLPHDGTPGDGVISGTPTSVGTFTFTVKAGDSDGYLPDRSTTKQLTIAVVAPLSATAATGAAPTGIVGQPYNGLAPAANGGLPPYTWKLAGGTLPPGLTVDPATGALSGSPTAAGTFEYTLGVTDTGGRTASVALSVTVVEALNVVTTQVPNGKVLRPYRTTLRATGGAAPVRWRRTQGQIPPGLRLNVRTGVLSGKPRKAGAFRFTVTASDTLGQKSSSEDLMIRVTQSLKVVTARVPNGKVLRPYRTRLRASGAAAPVRWQRTRGRIPPGVQLNTRTGVLSGKPRRAGRFHFTVKVTDALGQRSSKTFALKVRR